MVIWVFVFWAFCFMYLYFGLFVFYICILGFLVTCVEHQMVVKAASLSKFLAAKVARELVPGQTRLSFHVLF